MSQINPLPGSHVLYLGEVFKPPAWFPPNTHSTIMPILATSRVGLFSIENPTADEVRYLERIARESFGIVTVFKAGEADFCLYIGSQNELCEKRPSWSEGEKVLDCGHFAAAVQRYAARVFTLTLPSGPLKLGDRTKIMGILNVTPDSFSDGGRFLDFDAAIAHAEKMVADGADIIDVGGESTRPGADALPVEEEAKRVIPVVEHLAKNLPVPISIDTCKAEIARRALEAGAEMVNDISALRFDEKMAAIVRESGCPLILMHMRGTPSDMQDNPRYDALIPEIVSFLRERIDFVLKHGISEAQVVIDPGIGFGKTVDHNLEIIRELSRLKALGRPILVGPSRKSTIGKILDAESYDRVEGTAATVAVAIANGAHLARVHDVKEMARVAKMTDAIIGRKWK